MKHLLRSAIFRGAFLAVLAAVVLPLSLAAPVYQPQERLSKRQLAALIATARTPAEHKRLADYYRLESERLSAEADKHADMAGRFLGNSATNNDKSSRGTVMHCIAMERRLRAKAARARALSDEHKRIAQGAEQR